VTNLTDQELTHIVQGVVEALRKENPAFVTLDVCNERYGWLRKAILGLYGLVGGATLVLLAVILRS